MTQKRKQMPAIMFYTGDWLKDPAVRCLTLSQRGLWIDMLCLMYESPVRGHLSLVNGSPVSNEQLSRMVGARLEFVEECLHHMENCGVFSRTKEDVIYSRRMIDDEKKREAKAKAGRASGRSRNKGGTKAEQNVNETSTPLEYEYESESEEEYIPAHPTEKFAQKSAIQDVWSKIPSNRRRGRSKFVNAWIEKVSRANLNIDKVINSLLNYYKSDEGKGKFWRNPATLIEDEIWSEDTSQWSVTRGEEAKFPQSPFDQEKIINRYCLASEANNEAYLTQKHELEQSGEMSGEISRRVSYAIWKKYPEFRF